jgi:hypothetical protein
LEDDGKKLVFWKFGERRIIRENPFSLSISMEKCFLDVVQIF